MIILRTFRSIGLTIWQLSGKFFRLYKKIFHWKNLLHYDNALAFALLYLFLLALGNLDFEVLNPIGDAFDDVAVTDVLYSKMGKNAEFREVNDGVPEKDPDIVIVNIGHLQRGEIGDLVWLVNNFEPKVIGVDAIFDRPLDPHEKLETDSARFASTEKFAWRLSGVENLVLASKARCRKCEDEEADYEFEGLFDTIEGSCDMVAMQGELSMANLYLPEASSHGFKVCRQFIAGGKVQMGDSTKFVDHFTMAIMKHYDKKTYDDFKKRGNTLETVNYVGNIYPVEEIITDNQLGRVRPFRRFLTYDWRDFFYNPSFQRGNPGADSAEQAGVFKALKGKIVLFGFLGTTLQDIDNDEDKFFTPLNPNYVGKAKQDMYGVVIHANILAMMKEKNYVQEMGNFWRHFMGILVVYLVFASFRPIYNDYKNWYDGLTKVISIVISLIILFITGWLFDSYNFKIDFGGMYFATVLLAGDWLEVYYGFIKGFARRIKQNM